jgi:small subunit ribosomal protein S2
VAEIGMKDLLEAGVHFGHQTRRWNPQMKRFIFMERNGIYIIDLQKTIKCIQDARAAIEKAVRGGGHVLFVATKKQAKQVVAEEAQRCGMFYVTERWLGGMLTNFKTIRSSVKRLKDLDRMASDGTFEKLAKKEVARLGRERTRLEFAFAGIKEMPGLPALAFIIDTKKEKIAVAEANRLGIRALRLFARLVADTVGEARATALEGRDQETVSFGGEGVEGESESAPTANVR